MILTLTRKIFGTKNDRELKRMSKVVKQVNQLEDDIAKLSDDDLKAKTSQFRERLESGEALDQILPEAFAVCREASKRIMGMRHFDVQLIGGMTLHEGRIAEMRTGEGKTLMATLATYLNAIGGKGVHIVTVNDYLAQRDADWMRPLYEGLGLSVGVVVSMQSTEEKQAAYQSDITYGTNNEFGFDYLRDNMVLSAEDRMQGALNFAIVDEVDSILIDEARTPLIISGPAKDSSELYKVMNGVIPLLKEHKLAEGDDHGSEVGADGEHGHYIVDEKMRSADLTEAGHELVEKLLIERKILDDNESLYAASNLSKLHHVLSALKAHKLWNKNVEYIIHENQVVLIDEHTGRKMMGRRLSEGLHQALEAKENLTIQKESQTLASTTFQNYFRLYPKLSGMTGTADTESVEFSQIYGLGVVVIPTNVPIKRRDLNDLIYLTMEDKFEGILKEVSRLRELNVPVLVGTASVDTSEAMSERFKKAGIVHEVLNAKQHDREADIIAQAGRPGAITIATNMAGRGTNIVLGGKWEAEVEALDNPTQADIDKVKQDWEKRRADVLAAGGLHIVGTERHESRRIDNQLRGRAGRQGDPGESRFYLSLEDSLMRIFASDRVRGIMGKLGMEQGEAIEHKMVTNSIEKAQRKVEGRNFDYRKQLLEYDDVANDQRRVIYAQRNDLLDEDNIKDAIDGIRRDVVDDVISSFVPPQSMEEQWDVPGLEAAVKTDFSLDLPIQQWLDEDKKLYEEPLREKVVAECDDFYQQKRERIGPPIEALEKQVMLHVLDGLWKEHLSSMDHLRMGIGLRAFAQKNPKQEYKRESFQLFEDMLNSLKHEVTKILCRVEPVSEEEMAHMQEQKRQEAEAAKQRQTLLHQQASGLAMDSQNPNPQPPGETTGANMPKSDTFVRNTPKVGRNAPCPCGSGKKYKACHGRLG